MRRMVGDLVLNLGAGVAMVRMCGLVCSYVYILRMSRVCIYELLCWNLLEVGVDGSDADVW